MPYPDIPTAIRHDDSAARCHRLQSVQHECSTSLPSIIVADSEALRHIRPVTDSLHALGLRFHLHTLADISSDTQQPDAHIPDIYVSMAARGEEDPHLAEAISRGYALMLPIRSAAATHLRNGRDALLYTRPLAPRLRPFYPYRHLTLLHLLHGLLLSPIRRLHLAQSSTPLAHSHPSLHHLPTIPLSENLRYHPPGIYS